MTYHYNSKIGREIHIKEYNTYLEVEFDNVNICFSGEDAYLDMVKFLTTNSFDRISNFA